MLVPVDGMLTMRPSLAHIDERIAAEREAAQRAPGIKLPCVCRIRVATRVRGYIPPPFPFLCAAFFLSLPRAFAAPSNTVEEVQVQVQRQLTQRQLDFRKTTYRSHRGALRVAVPG